MGLVELIVRVLILIGFIWSVTFAIGYIIKCF